MVLADPWALGWDALVAIGTLTLAVVTSIVAGFTWRVASKTSVLAEKTSELATATQADVVSQFRPVIAPAEIPGPPSRGTDAGPLVWTYERKNGIRVFGLTNIGNGPALNVKVTAPGSDQTVDTDTTVLAVNSEPVQVIVHPPIQPNIDGGYTLLVQYDSVAEERYESRIVHQRRAENLWIPRLDRVKFVSRLRYVDVDDRVEIRDSATVGRNP